MEEGQPGSSDLSRTSSSTEIDDMDPENDAGGIWHEVRTRKRTRLANSLSASSSDTIIRPKPVKEGLTVIFAPGKAETVLTDLSSLKATARSCPKGREVETIQTYSKANSVDFHAAKSALEHEELFPALEFTPADSSVTKELAAASGFKDIAGNKIEHSKKPTASATPYASVLKATKPKTPKSQGTRSERPRQCLSVLHVMEKEIPT
ncbi:hypothetical protein HPB47_006864 [Ixodes persulcatus]|uniref:Uncharacterized protein n=1 Tax=Ixodes persulcatus TaxID=34615 RepID=A0AC60P8W6_IXOPE|nr:hypothetical protein HPB47_006864 [Ixodes persulcatus]